MEENGQRFDCRQCMRDTCTADKAKAVVRRTLPIINWLPKYRLKTLQGDLIAGMTVGLTVIPQGLAYAQVAELPQQYGLYSAFMGCFVYVFFGTAKDITLGPTAIMSLMTADFGASPVKHDATYAILLCLFSGIVQIVMGIFQLGFLVDFISYPVINGFTSAAAITIAFGQVKKLLGLKGIPREFLHSVYYTFKKIPETNYWDLIMGVVCMIILIAMKYVKDIQWQDNGQPVSLGKKILRKTLWILGTARNAIVVIGAGGVAAVLIYNNINVLNITGPLTPGLPPFRVPDFTINSGNITRTTGEIFSDIGIGFAIIPMIALVETIAIGKAFARKNDYNLDASQEFIAIGLANAISSFVSSYPVTGSFSRTAINSQSGVKTPMGGLFTGGLVLLALAVLTPWFYYIPQSALAGVIIVAVLQMVDLKIVRTLWRVQKWDLLPWGVTFILSFILGIEYGILCGVGVNLLMLLYPQARPKILTSQKEALVITMDQGLKFPAVEYLKDKIVEEASISDTPRSVVLDCHHVSGVDYSSILGIKQLLDIFKKHKVNLVFANLNADVHRTLEAAGIEDLKCHSDLEEACQLLNGQLGDDPSSPLLVGPRTRNYNTSTGLIQAQDEDVVV